MFAYQIDNGRVLIDNIKAFLKNKGINRTSEEEDLYDKSKCAYDYYTQLEKGEITIEDIKYTPLCWSEDSTWYLLGDLFIENDELYATIYDLHSGPPDIGSCLAIGLPIDILFEAYKILITQY